MPGQVMNDITNLGGEAHRPKHKTQDVMDGKENQVPPNWTPKGARPQSKPREVERPQEVQIWEWMRNVTRELVQCWAKNSANGGRETTPWMKSTLAKFGHFGPRVQSALLHGPPGFPPPPPPVGIWAEMNLPQQIWVDDGADKEIQELTADNLLLGPCHEQSEQLRPKIQDIEDCLTKEERESLDLWFSQVCVLHNLDDCVFQDCVVLLDRYAAISQDRSLLDADQSKCIAIFSIARKVAGAAGGNHCGSFAKRLGPEKFKEVLAAELRIVKALDYQTVTHSALDFLESFVFSLERHAPQEIRNTVSPLKCVAKFLLHLALGDANLLHGYPYAILAAGAVYVALWCTQASPERFLVLMQDVVTAVTPTEERLGDL